MAGHTRLTLVGSSRRVDVVLPDDEPLGRLLPEALRLTGEESAEPAAVRRLALLDGRLLEPDDTLDKADVPDGAVVRVVALAEAPPPPVVLDVTEETASALASQPGRWGEVPRVRAATALAVVATLAAVAIGTDGGADHQPLLLGLCAVLPVVGAAVGRWLSVPVGAALALAGTAVGCYAAVRLAPSSDATLAWSALTLCVALVCLGLGRTLGRGGVLGGGTGAVLLICWVAGERLLEPAQAAGCLAVLSTLLLGVLPRAAVVLSGLTGLDDRRARGEVIRRGDVESALAVTHRGLALSVVAVAASALCAGWRLAAEPNPWTVSLALLVATVLAIRVRVYPLTLEVLALVVAVAGMCYGLLRAWLDVDDGVRGVVTAVLAAAAVAAVAVLVVRPSPQLRARLRVVTDRVELLATVAMVPVLVGLFFVYDVLLETF